MRKYDNLIIFGGGGALTGAGFMTLISGKGSGALALLAGIALMGVGYAKLMRGAGYLPGDGDIDGVPGRQQSEINKMDQPVVGEQSANIWEQLEK